MISGEAFRRSKKLQTRGCSGLFPHPQSVLPPGVAGVLRSQCDCTLLQLPAPRGHRLLLRFSHCSGPAPALCSGYGSTSPTLRPDGPWYQALSGPLSVFAGSLLPTGPLPGTPFPSVPRDHLLPIFQSSAVPSSRKPSLIS